MKYQSILFVSLLFLANTSFSQHIFPSQEEDPIWNVSVGIGNPYSITTRSDTLLDGQFWTPIIQVLGNDPNYLLGYYRVDSLSQRVYCKLPEDDLPIDEFLLYDFTLQEGDRLEVNQHYFGCSGGDPTSSPQATFNVLAVDTVLIEGIPRRRFELVYYYCDLDVFDEQRDTWIEGIGSIYHPFAILEYFIGRFPAFEPYGLEVYNTRCLQTKSDIIYRHPEIPFCNDQNIIYVDSSNTMGFQNGRNWKQAYNDLNNALEMAKAGDSIWIAKGTYYPTQTTNRLKSFQVKPGVSLFGGFSNTHTSLSQRNLEDFQSILSGNIGLPDSSGDNSFHVLRMDLDEIHPSLIDGLIIEAGSASPLNNSSNSTFSLGGGLFLEFVSDTIKAAFPVINNCQFKNNFAQNGGAIYCMRYNNGTIYPQVINSIFKNNVVMGKGGGIYLQSSRDSIYNSLIQNCRFENNTSVQEGSSLYLLNDDFTKLLIQKSIFKNGRSITNAGGISINGQVRGGVYKIYDSEFVDNEGDVGSAISILNRTGNIEDIYKLEIKNCFFEGNIARNEGGAIGWTNAKGRAILNLQQSTFINNYALFNGAGLFFDQDGSSGEPVLNISNCQFIKNTTSKGFDGAIHYATGLNAEAKGILNVWNSIFSQNLSVLGAYNARTSQFEANFLNNSFYNNGQAPFVKTNSNFFQDTSNYNRIAIRNSIIWEKQTGVRPIFINGELIPINFEDFHVENNIIFESPGSEELSDNNWIGVDPLYKNPDSLNFELLACSPAINAGKNDFLIQNMSSTDIGNNNRIQEAIVDLGAYEQVAFQVEVENIDSTSCFQSTDGSVSFQITNAVSPTLISWGNSQQNETIINQLSAGIYSFEIRDSVGCRDSIFLEIPQPTALQIEFALSNASDFSSRDGQITIESIGGGTPPYQLNWNTGESTQSLSALGVGEYTLKVEDQNGCDSTFIFEISASTNLEEYAKISSQIFPNPVEDFLYIDFPIFSSQGATIKIFNSLGQLVLHKEIKNKREVVNTSHLVPGYFSLIIENAENRMVHPFLKKERN